MVPVTIAFEYVSLWLDIWSFDQSIDKLWGPVFYGAPLEEFLFWFGAPPFVLTQYLYFSRVLYPQGKSHESSKKNMAVSHEV